MAEETEVSTKLTLDDNASKTLKNVQRGFEQVSDEADDSKKVVSDFGKQFMTTFAAMNAGAAIGHIRDFMGQFTGIASAAYDNEQGIAGLLAGMTGTEWATARAYAEDINAEFNDLNINIGQNKQDIHDGYRAIITYLGGTSDAFKAARDNIGALTAVSNVQGVAVAQLAGEFGKLAAGYVAMESPVFNLLKGTGIFAADSKKIQEEWQKLTQTERVDRLSKAFEKIGDNLADAPSTLSDLKTSLGGIGDEFLETFGKSAMSQFVGEVSNLKGTLIDTRGDMQDLANDWGGEVGRFVADMYEGAQQSVAWLKDNSEEIKDSVKEGFQFARESIAWIIDNKTTLMAIGGAFAISRTGLGGMAVGLGGGMVGQMGAGLLGAIGGGGGRAMAVGQGGGAAVGGGRMAMPALTTAGAFVDDAAAKAYFRQSTQSTRITGRLSNSLSGFVREGGPAVQMGGKLGMMLGGLTKAFIAGGPVIWGAGAAIGALTTGAMLLADKIGEAEEKRVETINTNVSEFEQITQKMGALNKQELKRLDELRAEAEQMAADRLIPAGTADKFEAAWQARQQNILQAYVHPMQNIVDEVQRYGAMMDEQQVIAPETMEAQALSINVAAQLYQKAWKAHDEGAMAYVAELVTNSDHMRRAFYESADLTAEGFEQFATTVRKLSSEFANPFATELEGLANMKRDAAAAMANPVVNFNGGQVFKIQQNFRDQNPDQVVVSFQRKVTQAAISRTQPMTTTPFGT